VSAGAAEHVGLAESWLIRHGLPYFVDSERSAARKALSARRLAPVILLALAAGTGFGILVGWLAGDATNATAAGSAVVGVVMAAYAAVAVRAWPIATWAVTRTFQSLHLLFPLVTRALPLLLLFITFLFINTEVWQVATSLKGGILWGAVLLFATVAVGFLLVRLPEELDDVDDEIHGARLVESCAGTPLADVARDYVDGDQDLFDLAAESAITGFQKANLILVLLVSQFVQVLLLALSVFVFFVVFGSIVMTDAVVDSWIGHLPRSVVPGLPGPTVELTQVAVFLAAFSGLYFTVYAVTDETYRRQFFTAVTDELERAVGVRAVYRALRRQAADAG
jgi:hypothetical protein